MNKTKMSPAGHKKSGDEMDLREISAIDGGGTGHGHDAMSIDAADHSDQC